MSAQLERRRFRTWEPETGARPDEAWRVVLKYGLLCNLRSWYILLPLVLSLVAVVVSIGAASYGWADPIDRDGVQYPEVLGLATMFFVLGGVFVFLVGTPLLSEDLRFNAHLFYFSKPLRVRHYLAGKAALLGAFLAATVLLPVVLAILLAAVVGGPGVQAPDFQGLYGSFDPSWPARAQHEWETQTLRGAADWLYLGAVLVCGTVAALAFLLAVTLAVSAFTRRAWHAAMGLVAILGGWGILGVVAMDLTGTAWQNVFGPAGWFYLLLAMPLELRFGVAANPATGIRPERYDAGGPAVLCAYAIVGTLTYLAGWLALRRLQRQEALL